MVISSQKFEFASRVIRKILKNYKGKFALIILLGSLAGLLGGVGIGAIIPLFSVLMGQSIEGADVVTRTVEGLFVFFNVPFTLFFLAVFIVLLFAVKALVQFLAKYVNGRVMAEFEAKLRSDLFNKTLGADWSYLLNQKGGFLERVIMNDVYISGQILELSTNLILLSTSLAMYAFVAFNISAGITLLTIGFGAVLFFVFRPLYYKTRTIMREASNTEKTIAHYLSESILNSKAIKVFGVENQVAEKAQEQFEKLRDLRIRATLYRTSVGPSFEPLGFAFAMSLFIIFHKTPGFNIISFAAVIYLVQKMFYFIEGVQGNSQRLGELVPYFQSVLDYRSLTLDKKETMGGPSTFGFERSLIFDNVKFSYENGATAVSGLNFSIKKGEMIGLIGSSGSGKTTIADLILRLFRPDSGNITLDGVNADEINLKSWRKKIGYVSQDVFLLNDTVENNIRFFDKSVSKKDITGATKAANADSFIQKLPQGLNTIIGERGVKLSVGQRQRIALARVLARNPEILILDEATSALDNKSELMVQRAIENLKGKVTVLAIAHRLSTVMNSDKLLILEKGKILEEGSPQQLLKDKDSHFYKIYNIREN